jgi:predicted TIM-barrel fold metal-dependent hydrolase
MWVPDLLRNLKMAYGKMPSSFSEHPVEQFKRQVWISPYYEDDMSMLKDQVGIERLMFGSDFPHTEGLADPCAFVKDIPDFDADETKIVMRDNVYEFLGIAA